MWFTSILKYFTLRVTDNSFNSLQNKIVVLLEEERQQELATTPDEECVVCISAKATMQTFPCGHRVVCRKCFLKTIEMAVSRRMLPLRCVICSSKILRLKQTSRGGLNTGHVLRNSKRYANTNPFYISPETSPVSPVTQVFREQRVLFIRHYREFGYNKNGESPVDSPQEHSKSGASSCVLHKHCKSMEKSSNSPIRNEESSSYSSSSANSGAFLWQIDRKKKYSRSFKGRRHVSKCSRPNSLLLPIDESEELQELLHSTTSKPFDDIEETECNSRSESKASIHAKMSNNNNKGCNNSNYKYSQTLYSKFIATIFKAKQWRKKEIG